MKLPLILFAVLLAGCSQAPSDSDTAPSAEAAKSPTDAASPAPPAPPALEDAPTDTAEAMQSPLQADAPQDTAPVPGTSIEQRRKKRPRTTSPDLGNSRL